MYTCKLSVKYCSREFFNCLDRNFLSLLKLMFYHSGKFAPRENNPLYGIWHDVMFESSCWLIFKLSWLLLLILCFSDTTLIYHCIYCLGILWNDCVHIWIAAYLNNYLHISWIICTFNKRNILLDFCQCGHWWCHCGNKALSDFSQICVLSSTYFILVATSWGHPHW